MDVYVIPHLIPGRKEIGNSAHLETSLALQCVPEGAFLDCGGDPQRPFVMHWPRPMKETLAPLFDPGGTKIPALHPEHFVHPSDRQTDSK